MNRHYRQGDILIVSVAAIPKGAKPRRREGGRIVLARGEATGHVHAIASRGAVAYEDGSRRYLQIGKHGATLSHEEHGPINLPPGEYRVVRQREYVPRKAARNVLD